MNKFIKYSTDCFNVEQLQSIRVMIGEVGNQYLRMDFLDDEIQITENEMFEYNELFDSLMEELKDPETVVIDLDEIIHVLSTSENGSEREFIAESVDCTE